MSRSNRLKCYQLIFLFIMDSSGLPQMKPYEFGYRVNDSSLGNYFGHSESSDGQVVRGQYYVLLPDGQRQTVAYTADAVNGYQAQVVAYTPTNKVADSTQQRVNQHLDYILKGNESKFMNDEDTDGSRLLFGCSAEIKNRFSECLARCMDLISCAPKEKKNFLSACHSGIIQICTVPPQPTQPTPQPTQPTPQPTTLPPTSKVKCGVEKNFLKRIVNGVDVNIARKYSWQVGLKVKGLNEGKYWCGGSIITNKHILTTANCVCDKAPNVVYIGIGDHNQKDKTDNLPDFVKPIRAKKIIVHEDNVCGSYNELENDIAIIELSRPIDLEKHAEDIHPICLPKDDSKTYAGLTATVTGWGGIVGINYPFQIQRGFSHNQQFFPNVLQETQISVLKNSRCSNKLDGYTLRDTLICTLTNKGFETGGSGDCEGDGGGPASVIENAQHTQIGIVSFGLGCATKENPNVYTRVSKFLRWIKKQVGSEDIYTPI